MNANEIYEQIKYIPEDTSFDMPNIEAFVRLAEKLPKQATILEIGTWLGRSAMTWLLATGGNLTSIDINQDTQRQAEQHATELGFADKSKFIIGSANEIEIGQFSGGFDVVWIDGDHSYEACMQDIKKFDPFARILICGHDYAPAFPGVIQAVDEYFGKDNVQHDGNIWYVFKNKN